MSPCMHVHRAGTMAEGTACLSIACSDLMSHESSQNRHQYFFSLVKQDGVDMGYLCVHSNMLFFTVQN